MPHYPFGLEYGSGEAPARGPGHGRGGHPLEGMEIEGGWPLAKGPGEGGQESWEQDAIRPRAWEGDWGGRPSAEMPGRAVPARNPHEMKSLYTKDTNEGTS